jgi:putative drug exporter of the RND superfamily
MFNRIINFATSRPKRVIALWAIVVIALASVSTGFGYKVVSDDASQFLPKGSESARAADFARSAFGQQDGMQTVSMLVKRADGGALTTSDQAEIRSLVTAMPRWRVDPDSSALQRQVGDFQERAGLIAGARVGPVAPDGRLQLVGLQWKGNTTDPVAQEFFSQARDRAADRAADTGLTIGFTGGVASRADHVKAHEGMQALSQALLFGSIIALSLLFFRGPLAAIVPLVAIYLVAWLCWRRWRSASRSMSTRRS